MLECFPRKWLRPIVSEIELVFYLQKAIGVNKLTKLMPVTYKKKQFKASLVGYAWPNHFIKLANEYTLCTALEIRRQNTKIINQPTNDRS